MMALDSAVDPRALGPFELLAVLGEGGMGRAYLARRLPLAGLSPEQEYDYRLAEQVDAGDTEPLAVVKVIRPDLLADESAVTEREVRGRFSREIDAVRTVVSERVPALLAADPHADRPWLAMEYIHGPTLHTMVTRHGVLGADDPARYAALGLALVDALRDIHKADLLHRDLKPGNVVLGPSGPVVLDFGLAVLSERSSGQGLTKTGRALGTLKYLPMEQYKDARNVTPAADVYALGATLFFAATGRSPYPEGPRHTPPDTSDLPSPFSWLLGRIITAYPDQRPDLDEVEEDLLGLLSGHGVTPLTAAERLRSSVAESGLVPVLPEAARQERPDPTVRAAAQHAVDAGDSPDAPWGEALFDEFQLEAELTSPAPPAPQPPAPQYTPTLVDPQAAAQPPAGNETAEQGPSADDSPATLTSYRLEPPEGATPAAAEDAPAAATPSGARKAAERLRRRYVHSGRL